MRYNSLHLAEARWNKMSANLLRCLVDDDPGFHKQREHRTGISLHCDHQYLGKVGQNSQKRLPLGNFDSIA